MSDIEWSPWIKGCESEAKSHGATEIQTTGTSVHVDDVTHYRIPMSDYKRITGMPEWDSHHFGGIAQDRDGQWVGACSCNLMFPCRAHWGTNKGVTKIGSPGTVLGDWRETLQERPQEYTATKGLGYAAKAFELSSNMTKEKIEIAAEKLAKKIRNQLDSHPSSEPDADRYSVGADTVDDCEDRLPLQYEPEEERTSDGAVSMADQYPAYYKDVSGVSAVDVYAVHQLFGVDDPSGCIHHASKKLLLSGVRTGGKSKRDDIREARDTLNRWLDLNHE